MGLRYHDQGPPGPKGWKLDKSMASTSHLGRSGSLEETDCRMKPRRSRKVKITEIRGKEAIEAIVESESQCRISLMGVLNASSFSATATAAGLQCALFVPNKGRKWEEDSITSILDPSFPHSTVISTYCLQPLHPSSIMSLHSRGLWIRELSS